MTEAKIWKVTFGYNTVSRDVKANNIYTAISKARRLEIEERKRDFRDWKFMLREPVTACELMAYTDD